MKKLIIDLDGTLTAANTSNYNEVLPRLDVIEQVRNYKDKGFEIVISTARNMRTHRGNVGKINIHTLPIIVEWLDRHDIPYDEIIVGKPWCGHEGFYVDDRAIRPSEFSKLSLEKLYEIIDKDKKCS